MTEYGKLKNKRLIGFYRWIIKKNGKMSMSEFQRLSLDDALIEYEKETQEKKNDA